MRLSRIIMALTVGLAVLAAPTAAGAAQPQPTPGTGTPQPPPYAPGPATLAVSPPTVVVGQTATLIGSDWTPGGTVTITVSTSPLAAAVPGADQARRSNGETVAMAPVSFQRAPQPNPTRWEVVADGDGEHRSTYTPREPGTYTFRAVGETPDQVATATLTVLKKHQAPLPVTGDSMSTPLKFGGGLVGAGAVLLLLSLVWRKRHRFGVGAAR
ncbi:hypothetical protein [Micromonospora peucetia]|uniref:LPXTG-motif cell wall anchor domain-containing protein n=1 Tax=Micromonospora peucetia TaxID=47871 RepID=A0A1C6VZZ3_9ACTN|nr:hypothetical protein [Micromonospora peucetia]WSA31713.1 hypothetical protein OIE14_26895 [Micromonospora peucetia]SCL71767.1 hypothetical protein GA0070608_4748 [Micromonospora peucetia]